MKREIKTNAEGVKKIISHYGSKLSNMPIVIFHQGVPGKYVIVVQDDYTTRFGLADQVKSILA